MKKIVFLIEIILFILFLLWIVCWFVGVYLYSVNKPEVANDFVIIGCGFYFAYVICDKVVTHLEGKKRQML